MKYILVLLALICLFSSTQAKFMFVQVQDGEHSKGAPPSEYREEFEAMDLNKDGEITPKDVMFGGGFTQEQVDYLLEHADIDGSGTLNFGEYEELRKGLDEVGEEVLHHLEAYIDNQVLDLEDFLDYGQTVEGELSQPEIEFVHSIIDEVDEDHLIGNLVLSVHEAYGLCGEQPSDEVLVEAFQETFDEADESGDGEVSVQELLDYIDEEDVEYDFVSYAVSQADENDDGVLNKEEFTNLMFGVFGFQRTVFTTLGDYLSGIPLDLEDLLDSAPEEMSEVERSLVVVFLNDQIEHEEGAQITFGDVGHFFEELYGGVACPPAEAGNNQVLLKKN